MRSSILRALSCCLTLAIAVCASPAWAAAWNVLTRDGAGRDVPPYLSSLGSSLWERGTGAVRSETFTLDADMVSFEMCGADGRPGTRVYRNWFFLCDAETGRALRQTPPPGTDSMTPVQWDVVELIGRRVYFRAVDGIDDTAFAWIGWKNVRVGDRALMPTLIPGRLPEGWAEEVQPEGVSTDEWLQCGTADSRLAVEVTDCAPTWGVLEVNGERRTCEPYLSSLRGGEQGTGAVRSPVFALSDKSYTFVAMGADSPSGDAGLNFFQLVDAQSSQILRSSEPPVGNTMVPIAWDTQDLIGRKVFFRAVDGNNGGGWAWLGCDKVPLGEGAVATFSDPKAIEGWREESQAEGTPVGGSRPAASSLRELVEQEWEAEDTRRGVRWSLWESNPGAAPYLLKRLTRIMDGDFSRGRQLLREFRAGGAPADTLRDLSTRLRALEARYEALGSDASATAPWQRLRHDQRVLLRELTFANPGLSCDRLLFVKRFTQQTYADINVNHHAWGSKPGGDICILDGIRDLASPERMSSWPEAKPILAGQLGPGNVHGIDLHWDAGRVLFAYSRNPSGVPPEGWLARQSSYDIHRSIDLLHLYEVNIDGSGLRQLTDGQWSDLNPCYLPSEDIVFESERCGFSLQCNEYDKDEPTTNLYTMRPDGSGIRRLAVTKDGDWYPRVHSDGSLIYSHWEYHERSLMFLHPLWTVRPDGTGEDAFVKQHFNYPVALTAPRPIPDSRKVIAVATGHHTLAAGPIVIVDRAVGINDPSCLTRVTGPGIWPELGGAAPEPNVPGWRLPPGEGWYMDPYPLSETTFLCSYCDGTMQDETGHALYLVDVYGGKELLYRDPAISSVMPIPLVPRSRPATVADARDGRAQDAACLVANVAYGVPELAPGAVKSLRIAEPVSWPYTNDTGGQRYEPDAKATGVNWTPVRIIGTVPVEQDGSAYFRVPADKALYFQALDAQGMELRRMRTYVSFQAGETRGCLGCHETRPQATPLTRSVPLAVRRTASEPVPPPWGQEPLSFLRDIQPMLTRNCLSCHSGLKPAGDVDLSPGLTTDYNRAYDALIKDKPDLISVSNKNDDTRITPVLEYGSHRSRLITVLREGHKDRVHLSDDEWHRLYTWIDANAIYHDAFIIKRPESALPYNLAEDRELWAGIEAIQQRRCASCHQGQSLARPEWVDLSVPERSLFLTAPMKGAKTPSGRACSPAVFESEDDSDYQALLGLVHEARERTWKTPRRDLRCLAGSPDLMAALSFPSTPPAEVRAQVR